MIRRQFLESLAALAAFPAAVKALPDPKPDGLEEWHLDDVRPWPGPTQQLVLNGVDLTHRALSVGMKRDMDVDGYDHNGYLKFVGSSTTIEIELLGGMDDVPPARGVVQLRIATGDVEYLAEAMVTDVYSVPLPWEPMKTYVILSTSNVERRVGDRVDTGRY